MLAKTIVLATIVCAVFVQGTAAQGANLALGKPATQSSTWNGEAFASRAVDGNTATNWGSSTCTATENNFEPWLRVDLQSVQTLSSVKLWNRGDCCPDRLHDVSIYIGNNAAAFGNNPTCAMNVDVPQTPAGYVVSCVGTGRYLWVAIPGKTNYLTMCELQAFGPLTTPAPPTPVPPTPAPPTPVPPTPVPPTPVPPTPVPATHDPAVSAFCDDIAAKCTALDAECATIRTNGYTSMADDCDASVAVCNDMETDCRDKAASCPLV